MSVPPVKEMNVAIFAKLLWRLVQQPDTLSSRTLREKYGGWSSIISEGKAKHGSYVWRGLQFSASWFRRGLT